MSCTMGWTTSAVAVPESDDSSTAPKLRSTTTTRRPQHSRFTQQELPAWKPILTPKRVICAFMLISIVSVSIGVAALHASQDVVEIIDRYESECIPEQFRSDKVGYIKGPENKSCNRTLRVSKHMKQPIYVYYQLDNFYQNHRRYVQSRSDPQLLDPKSVNETTSCEPLDRAKDVELAIVPCGLIAWSLFNDTYSLSRNEQELVVNKTGISWESEREHKFGKHVFSTNFQLPAGNGSVLIKGGASLNSSKPLSEDEDLMVWMRPAALPTFRKLYGKIGVDLEAGDVIQVRLQNNYNTYSFNGKKKLVLSTASWLGGKNDFLGIAYITIAAICFSFSLFFSVVYVFKRRPLGDPSYLSWNRNPNPNPNPNPNAGPGVGGR